MGCWGNRLTGTQIKLKTVVHVEKYQHPNLAWLVKAALKSQRLSWALHDKRQCDHPKSFRGTGLASATAVYDWVSPGVAGQGGQAELRTGRPSDAG